MQSAIQLKTSSVLQKLVFFIFAAILMSCVSKSQLMSTAEYNDDWWKPVPDSELASWEVPPQAADRSKNEVVLSKRTELRVFSNLALSPFEMDGINYQSIEGLWQGMKYPENSTDERWTDPKTGTRVVWPYTREQVYQMSDFESKVAGDQANEIMKKLGIKWVTYQGQKIEYKGKDQAQHYEIIFRASVAKVQQNETIKELLLKTKGLTFIIDHKQDPNSPPAYRTDLIFKKIRDE